MRATSIMAGQRMRVHVSAEERRLISAGYNNHGTDWDLVVNHILQRIDHEDPIWQQYLGRTPTQQKRRVRDVVTRDIMRFQDQRLQTMRYSARVNPAERRLKRTIPGPSEQPNQPMLAVHLAQQNLQVPPQKHFLFLPAPPGQPNHQTPPQLPTLPVSPALPNLQVPTPQPSLRASPPQPTLPVPPPQPNLQESPDQKPILILPAPPAQPHLQVPPQQPTLPAPPAQPQLQAPTPQPIFRASPPQPTLPVPPPQPNLQESPDQKPILILPAPPAQPNLQATPQQTTLPVSPALPNLQVPTPQPSLRASPPQPTLSVPPAQPNLQVPSPQPNLQASPPQPNPLEPLPQPNRRNSPEQSQSVPMGNNVPLSREHERLPLHEVVRRSHEAYHNYMTNILPQITQEMMHSMRMFNNYIQRNYEEPPHEEQ
ncbi:vegetative cell wall protein gp1-like [Patiria miniata]|uniref:Extensin-like n=1 Tax=Patiria miniata TaxID=46514 RepID=A0A914BPW8_PATMI|nr:vegetative cell wall protein gp1-like [Patiria miniata]